MEEEEETGDLPDLPNKPSLRSNLEAEKTSETASDLEGCLEFKTAPGLMITFGAFLAFLVVGFMANSFA